MVPLSAEAPTLSKRGSPRNPPIIASPSLPSPPSSDPNREQTAEEALSAIQNGSSVQVSVLIAMPVPEAVALRRKLKSSQFNDDEEELPELEIGYVSLDVDEDTFAHEPHRTSNTHYMSSPVSTLNRLASIRLHQSFHTIR
jgi:hypothetical protein